MNQTPPTRAHPAAIAREIDVTRSEVDQTLDALQAKLSPGQLLDRAVEFMRENGGELANSLGRSVRRNPLPMILTGVGLIWMMSMSRASAHPQTGRLSGDGLTATGRRPSGSISGLMREQPVLVGAVALALGVLLGYALPSTEAED